jgi:hypothetical protein
LANFAADIVSMRIRASSSAICTGSIFAASAAIAAVAFIACGPAPVVVTDADQALVIPKSSASAIASANTVPTTNTTNTTKPPLLVPDETIANLPPFQCSPDKQLDLLGQTFCVINDAHGWHDAEASCQKIGAHLATMKNSLLPNALRNAIGSPTGVNSFFIGLAEPNEGRWIWSNGTPMRFSAFRRGEPNNAGRGEDCAEWLVEDGRWNDVDCFQPKHFLCEAPAVPAGSRAKGLTCRGQRFTIEKTDYCLESPARWDVAQRTCVQNGGELAMLDTDAENTTLFKHLGVKMALSNIWIGLNDQAIEGQFRWISGEPLEISIWHPGEPNDFEGAEDCVEWVTADARWNDRRCSDALPALCEKPQSSVAK